jgi:hypothetical protein
MEKIVDLALEEFIRLLSVKYSVNSKTLFILFNSVKKNGRICKYSTCEKQPAYGIKGTKKAEYCVEHKPEGYVDVKHKTCLMCEKRPTYGINGTKKAEYCVDHKPEGYVDVKSKTCLMCEKLPTYGIKGTKKAEYCVEHKPEGYVDVVNKTCLMCEKQPHYGVAGYSAEYCATHKDKFMIIHPTKVKVGDFKECAYCKNKIHYRQDFCRSCNNYNKTGKTFNRGKKELEIKLLLQENKIEFKHDTIIPEGCSKRRPDFYINTNRGIIILEIDEHQHNRKGYTCECEVTRMKQIYMDCCVSNVLFIRYNPDAYISLKGRPYGKDKRENYLIEYLKDSMFKDSFQKLTVVYLFYDGFYNSPEIDEINPYI